MKQLFVDDYIVEEIHLLARVLHQPRKIEGTAVVRPEYRWENMWLQIRGAPAWDPNDGLYKMIYGSAAESLEPNAGLSVTGAPACEGFMCYATSEDGVNWEKPFLELHDYPGISWNGQPMGKANNILPSAKGLWLAPIYDAGEPDPERRFKGLGWPPGGSSGMRPAVSADGVHWRYLDVAPVLSADEAQFTYDEDKGRYILTVKHNGPYGRSVYLTTSEDLENWSEQELIFHADQQDQENGKERLARFFNDPRYERLVINRPGEYKTDVYHMAVFPYEGLYLGMPVMFHQSGKHFPMYENVDGRKTIELTSSRDLKRWNRVADRAPFLEHSQVGDGSAYDTGQMEPANRPIIRNNELWFYYTGLKDRSITIARTINREYLDSGAVCMARLRMDGFVSLKGGIEWGSVLTVPIAVEDRQLHINADAWRGRVKAGIIDASDGHPVPGFSKEDSVPAMVDNTDVTLGWKGKTDLSELRGKTVRIRFWVQGAELYAFWFGG